jgi:hypothetical protein
VSVSSLGSIVKAASRAPSVVSSTETRSEPEEEDDDEDQDSDQEKKPAAAAKKSKKAFEPLVLTEEERKIMIREKITLPDRYPLSREEERNLRRIRRKIRNKRSAQDSRQRKKQYVDDLEKKYVMVIRKYSFVVLDSSVKDKHFPVLGALIARITGYSGESKMGTE